MGGARQTGELVVQGRVVAVSNLDKVLFPANGFTKAQVIDYYIRVSRWLLPHLKDRPVTLKRYPDGVTGEHFYEKDAPSFTPDWVRLVPVPRRGGHGDIRYVMVDDLPTLVWLANLANLEIHPFLHRAPAIDTPTNVAFDLDPGEGADIHTCAEVAYLLKIVLDGLKLKCFVKVSGSKGLQVYVPLNTPVTYPATQAFAKTVAELLEKQYPKLIVSDMAKIARAKKVFIDWSQNSDYKTTVGVYSLRAKRTTPFVSTPVTWEELRTADSLYFNPEAALERFEALGDLWAPVLKLKQRLPKAFEARKAPAPRKVVVKAPEPIVRRSKQGGRRRFVIQKHAASHLHYDLRLEMHDVLKSWAVPKGVPYTLDERRLARAVEDHPIEYLQFEGTIPQGQYGGGTVMVWDIGTYEIVEGNYYKGRLHIHLDGKKLKGEWMIERDGSKGEGSWTLTKVGKAIKPVKDTSALTGRTLEEIATAKGAVWQSNRLPDAKLTFVEPMQCKLVEALPEGHQWEYEIKLDGYRALAIRDDERLRLLSRRNNALNDRFPDVAKALSELEPGTMLDGEVVALGEDGKPSFNRLQNNQGPFLYFAFDLLAWKGKSVLGEPLRDRRDSLRHALAGVGDTVRLVEPLQAEPEALIRAAREQGLEGLIAKRSNSVYEVGQRSGAWVKLKVNKGQELVIGGYIQATDCFSSLLVGYYEGKNLIFIAKIKNGYTPKLKRDLCRLFKAYESAECPFANLPEPKNARRGEALTAAVMKRCTWLRPELVAQVEFTDWTDANHLRHSRFVALRDDKIASEVRKEVAS
ncbi:MAG TPA: non-homologous end-joining DNA ligase [Bryobacteraceae bacterium]|nr:non-homologous end-joining DNA ligase [Bryobacteraceae bacterium]